jgi:hypothetical protein
MRRSCFFTVWKVVRWPPSQRHLGLGADEEHAVAAEDDVAHELLRDLELPQGLLEIDDVDPVALREDEAAHLGIPTARLVSEMDTSGEKSFEGRLRIRHCLSCGCYRRRTSTSLSHRNGSAPGSDSVRL